MFQIDKEIGVDKLESLDQEFAKLSIFIGKRLAGIFKKDQTSDTLTELKKAFEQEGRTSFHRYISKHLLSVEEKVILLLALAPLLKPGLLDLLHIKKSDNEQIFSELGGVRGEKYHGVLPTIETAILLLEEPYIRNRLNILSLFDSTAKLRRLNLIDLSPAAPQDPVTTRVIRPTEEFIHEIVWERAYQPEFSSSFPATRIDTRLSWDDLVLTDETLEGIEEIRTWLIHKEFILQHMGLQKKIKNGYRSLFYGPPGTGKTLTAALLGKSSNMDVYRIDLSSVISKYIGETEKNLASIFNQAENKDWILFFDEADALFGKRAATKDAKDRYANQEISYLLQRIEDFPGIVILATNLKANMDEAFMRRFQSVIYFPIPGPTLRLELWEKAFEGNMVLDDGVDLKKLAKDYEISGGALINVLRFCSIRAVQKKDKKVFMNDILDGIRKEFQKEGKTL